MKRKIIDTKYKFFSVFDTDTGSYFRTGILDENRKDIGADMKMLLCSFDQRKEYEVSLRETDIANAWNSEPFERFREKLKGACPDCEKRQLCMGGCPLMPKIVFCNKERKILK